MTSLSSSLPPPGQPFWHGAPSTKKRESKVKHIVIKGTETRYDPSPYTVYKIDVLTEDNHWIVFRRYRQFYHFHQKLVKDYGIGKDLLPPKKYFKNVSPEIVAQRRRLLQQYLQKLINSDPEVSGCEELMSFLEVPNHDIISTTTALTQYFYKNGEKLLAEDVSFALTPNQMYCLCERLKLPITPGADDDISCDPVHLYDFVHHLRKLHITLPPSATSVTCSNFDLSPFKHLAELKMDHIPFSQLISLTSVHQYIEVLSISHGNLNSIKEVLVEKAAEIRPAPTVVNTQNMENWRIVATTKLPDKRVVIQPWHHLRSLSLRNNNIVVLHSSLLLLHSLKEMDLSHNAISTLSLNCLTLPHLTTLNVSHNCISSIDSKKKVLESIQSVDLSHNQLANGTGLGSFVNIEDLNLEFNAFEDINFLQNTISLKKIQNLVVRGNPISMLPACRLAMWAYYLDLKRQVTIDGHPMSSREQEHVTARISKYGSDVFSWPNSQKCSPKKVSPESPMSDGSLEDMSDDLMYAVVNSSLPPKKPVPVLKHYSHDSLLQLGEVEWKDSESSSLSPLDLEQSNIVEDPESPVLNLSPNGDVSSNDATPSNQVTPPPSTPLGASLTNEDYFVTNPNKNGAIHPQMILNALYALSRTLSESSDPTPGSSPGQQPLLNDDVATAIRSLINSQTSTPPPTPLAERRTDNTQSLPIQASDLVQALRHLVNHGNSFDEGDLEYTVPQSTPKEGERKNEVSIEELMTAVSKLAIGMNMESSHDINEEEGQGKENGKM